MTLDIASITILVTVAGLGSVAGYWGRIVQKVEDRRDEIYLTKLPAIYSTAHSLQDSLTLFSKSGIIDQLAVDLVEILKSLKDQVFSADIVIFEAKFYEPLLKLYGEAQQMQTVVEGIRGMKDPEKTEKVATFRYEYENAGVFPWGEGLEIKPRSMFDEGEGICQAVEKEFRSYRSYSAKLTLIIFVLGALVALLEIIKTTF